MSRSYKHYPFYKDRDSSKWGKTCANRKVRRTKGTFDRAKYKKLVQQYDYICDFCYCESWDEYQRSCKRWGIDPKYRDWYKLYKMK